MCPPFSTKRFLSCAIKTPLAAAAITECDTGAAFRSKALMILIDLLIRSSGRRFGWPRFFVSISLTKMEGSFRFSSLYFRLKSDRLCCFMPGTLLIFSYCLRDAMVRSKSADFRSFGFRVLSIRRASNFFLGFFNCFWTSSRSTGVMHITSSSCNAAISASESFSFGAKNSVIFLDAIATTSKKGKCLPCESINCIKDECAKWRALRANAPYYAPIFLTGQNFWRALRANIFDAPKILTRQYFWRANILFITHARTDYGREFIGPSRKACFFSPMGLPIVRHPQKSHC